MTHKKCGGKAVVDYDMPGFEDSETDDTYYPVKCDKCGAALGLLAEVESICLVQ